MIDWLIFALVIDALLGEPRVLWSRLPHPATLMGRAVERLDQAWNHGDSRRTKGVLAVLVLVLCAGTLGGLLAAVPDYGAIGGVLAAVLIAQRSLVEHVRAVAEGLTRSLDAGRHAVSMIVGRDPDALDKTAVARAAIESGAENFSDGVIAPAFWYLVAGLPGLLVYKTVNTADSMIGHRNERYAQFGWAAARLDDLLNWAPARLAAGLICLGAWSRRAWDVMRRDADLHASPNAGWPESAMAGALGVALAGPRSYLGRELGEPYLNPEGRRVATPADIDRAVVLLWRAWGVCLGVLLLARLML